MYHAAEIVINDPTVQIVGIVAIAVVAIVLIIGAVIAWLN